jgi:hypothetical protein
MGDWVRLLGPLLVFPWWVWLSVRTTRCLRVITRGTIPYSKRTVWLIKILALIVGAGGVAGALVDFGAPWFLVIVPAGIIFFFSVTEDVSEVVPPKPIQDPSAYQSAWREYWQLRRAYNRSCVGLRLRFY